MRSAARLFYLAVFTLLGTSHASSKPATKTASAGPDVCTYEPSDIVSDACASYSNLEKINDHIHSYLHAITHSTDFFSYYRLNLYNKKCPFWSDDEGMCGNIACAVNTVDNEDDIPLVWRAQELGKLEGPKAQHPGKRAQQERQAKPLQGELGEDVGESCVVEYDDECDERDYCVPEDERASAKGDYVSLVDNPERFTGYAGVSAHQVWEAIYRENCFSKPSAQQHGNTVSSPFGGQGGAFGRLGQAAHDLRSVMKERSVQQSLARGSEALVVDDGLALEDECLEKRVFYRIVSGMHASISMHLCWDHLNQTTGTWGPNLQCYEDRLHNHPERLSNIYFNYALLLRAVGKVRRHIKDYTFCSADPEQDRRTQELIVTLSDVLPAGRQVFDETLMFADPAAAGLKEDFKHRFRNISRIMDCVGCDKCRLWGKLQTAGYGTALKILFEFDEMDSSNDPPLRRTELVALINTLDRLSHSMTAGRAFHQMIEARQAGEAVKAEQSAVTSGDRSVPEKETSAGEKTDVDDGEEPDLGPKRRKRLTATEKAWDEWYRVWRAFAWVLRSWTEIPGKALKILLFETSRLWDMWIGLPVQPRTWEIKFPRRDEI